MPPTCTPTERPSASPSPSVTASPALPLGVRLEVASALAHPGTHFWVRGYLDNPGPGSLPGQPVFFVLDVFSSYYFWPSWRLYQPPGQPSVDFESLDIAPGTMVLQVVDPFVWPDTGQDQASGLRFYGAMLDRTLTAILGQMAEASWGYGP